MEEGFSGAVKLSNLNDLLASGQKCIKSDDNGDKRSISLTLSDCLACVGCLSSEEQIVISNSQNMDILKQNLSKSKDFQTNICIVSPQTVSSFSKYLSIPLSESESLICKGLRNIGFEYIFDQNWGKIICHRMLCQEFDSVIENSGNQSQVKPLIVSACPGLVCYAESSKHVLIPHLSKNISPPLALAIYIRKTFSNDEDKKKLYICSVTPCYDRKLEALRPENSIKDQKEPLVDCVIGSKNDNFNFHKNLDSFNSLSDVKLSNSIDYVTFLDTSDGYLECIKDHLIKKFRQSDDEISFSTKKLYNSNDFNEIQLNFSNGRSFKLAKVYGFRNIQILVQNIIRNKCRFDFIEAMACPKGCINGGAQLKAPNDAENFNDNNKNIIEIDQSLYDELHHFALNYISSYKLLPKQYEKNLNNIEW
ncbi:MAG: hypothetical protein MHPSP_000691 [Paramarteilia canceri]